jgi:hypothetical protein
MARCTYIAPISEIKGSVGSSTFQRNNSGYIVRLKPNRVSNSIRNAQSKFISLAKRTQEWKLLSALNISDWNAFAIAHSKYNAYNEIKYLTGFNWFCSINTNLELINESLISSPPAYTAPLSVPSFTFNFDLNGLFLTPSAPYNLGNNALLIYATPPITSQFLKQRSKLRLIYYYKSTTITSLNMRYVWESYFNVSFPSVSVPFNYGIVFMLKHIELTSGLSTIGTFLYDGLNTYVIGGIGNMIINSNFEIS